MIAQWILSHRMMDPQGSNNSTETNSSTVVAPQAIVNRVVPEGVENEEELRDVLNSNWMSIRGFFKCHKTMDVMNVCLLSAEESPECSAKHQSHFCVSGTLRGGKLKSMPVLDVS